MSLFTTFGFLGRLASKEADAAGRSLTAAIVRFDPATASQADIAGFESQLNTLTSHVADLRAEFNKEKGEYTTINNRYHKYFDAAERIKAKIADPANESQKAELQASLESLVGEIEKIAPDLDEAKKEADETEQSLKEFEQAATDMAAKIVTAKQRFTTAQHEAEHEALHKQRATEHSEKAAELAGIRATTDSMGVAIAALKDKTAKDAKAAEALELKARLLNDASHKALEGDEHIAKALRDAGDNPAPATSLSDRLAALKR